MLRKVMKKNTLASLDHFAWSNFSLFVMITSTELTDYKKVLFNEGYQLCTKMSWFLMSNTKFLMIFLWPVANDEDWCMVAQGHFNVNTILFDFCIAH